MTSLPRSRRMDAWKADDPGGKSPQASIVLLRSDCHLPISQSDGDVPCEFIAPNAQVQGRPLGEAEAMRRIGVPCNAQVGRCKEQGLCAASEPAHEAPAWCAR